MNPRNYNYTMAMLFKMTKFFDLLLSLIFIYLMGFLSCPLPYSLPSGSSARTLRRGRRPSLMGRDGTDGTGGTVNQKCHFFILRYIKHYTNIYLNIRKFPDKFLVGLKIWTSWGPDKKNQKHPLGRNFFKSV